MYNLLLTMGASDRARTETRALLMVASEALLSMTTLELELELFNLETLVGFHPSDSGLSSLTTIALFFCNSILLLFNDPEIVLSPDEECE